jgi:molecular chaperone DnaK (HSP70)
MVCFTKGKKATDPAQVLVGSTAVNLAPRNAENTIYDSKRMVGAMFNDQAVQKDLDRWPF